MQSWVRMSKTLKNQYNKHVRWQNAKKNKQKRVAADLLMFLQNVLKFMNVLYLFTYITAFLINAMNANVAFVEAVTY